MCCTYHIVISLIRPQSHKDYVTSGKITAGRAQFMTSRQPVPNKLANAYGGVAFRPLYWCFLSYWLCFFSCCFLFIWWYSLMPTWLRSQQDLTRVWHRKPASLTWRKMLILNVKGRAQTRWCAFNVVGSPQTRAAVDTRRKTEADGHRFQTAATTVYFRHWNICTGGR